MQSEKQNLGELYAERAMAESAPPVSTISIPKIREARDMVYNGNEITRSHDATVNNSVPRNKKANKRKVSPFTIILILLGVAIASILYIGNILAVGRLMAQINQLQAKHQQILNEQELLKAHMNRLSGLDRIQQIARNQLGLQNSKQIPIWIEIEPDRVNQVEEILQQQMERKQ